MFQSIQRVGGGFSLIKFIKEKPRQEMKFIASLRELNIILIFTVTVGGIGCVIPGVVENREHQNLSNLHGAEVKRRVVRILEAIKSFHSFELSVEISARQGKTRHKKTLFKITSQAGE